MTKQFTPDLKLKAVNYYHKIKSIFYTCITHLYSIL